MSAQLRIYHNIEEYLADHPEKNLDQIVWLVCLLEANALSDSFRRKDIASLFYNGVESYSANPTKKVNEFIQTINDLLLDYSIAETVDFISQVQADEIGYISFAQLIENIE